jgi:hypothetical protein
MPELQTEALEFSKSALTDEELLKIVGVYISLRPTT